MVLKVKAYELIWYEIIWVFNNFNII